VLKVHCMDSYCPKYRHSTKGLANYSTCVTPAKALRITYNTNVGLVPRPSRSQPRQYIDPAQFPYGTRVSLQCGPGSIQTTTTSFSMLDFEYNHIYSMQNLQRLDLSLELSSARFAIPDKQRDHIWYTAVSLSELEISILNIEVHFRDWYR